VTTSVRKWFFAFIHINAEYLAGLLGRLVRIHQREGDI